MNASTEERTRLACRVVRVWAAIRERETGSSEASLEARLPAATLRHMAVCAECRRFFIESRGLERALERDAIRERPPIPEGLDRRVSLAVSRSRPPRTGAFPRLAIAACGVAAVALGVILAERGFRAGEGGQASRRGATEEAQLAAEVRTLPGALWDSAKPAAIAVWREDPLRSEADALFSDAQSAVGFLKANFVPDSEVRTGAAPSS